MSRNPILTEKAFGLDSPGGSGGLSPSEEWQQAQQMRTGGATAAPVPPAAPGAPPVGGMPTGATTATSGGADAALARGGRGTFAPATDGKVMTMGGVAAATFVMFAFLLAAAFFGWQAVDLGPPIPVQGGGTTFDPTFTSPVILFIALFAALGLAILTSFKPHLARFTGIGYAVCEGYVLGAISAFFGGLYQGIVAQAVLATLGVFLIMLALYGLRILRATPKFVKGVIAATFGIMFMYLGVFLLNIFGVADGFWTSGSPLGIVISLVVVVVAALNLILDFDFIERGTKAGLPRYMDWYGGFGLLVTLVWLYLEMLRLLARLRQ